jgi:hypothetical protein
MLTTTFIAGGIYWQHIGLRVLSTCNDASRGERLARRARSHGGFLAIDQSLDAGFEVLSRATPKLLRDHRDLRASSSSFRSYGLSHWVTGPLAVQRRIARQEGERLARRARSHGGFSASINRFRCFLERQRLEPSLTTWKPCPPGRGPSSSIQFAADPACRRRGY